MTNKHPLNRDWVFRPSNTALYDDLQQEKSIVSLPYDYSIGMARRPDAPSGASGGYFPGDTVVFEKTIFAPTQWKHKKVFILFEGIYMNASIRLNDNLLGWQPYGYSSFHCDLTPYLLLDKENTLSVTVNNTAMPNTRWYSGSGIYRPVWLIIKEPCHIKPWGVCTVTPVVSEERSTAVTRTQLTNTSEQAMSALVRCILMDSDGNTVAASDTETVVTAGGCVETEQELIVSPTRLWSVDTPNLYTLTTQLITGNNVTDEEIISIGFRSLSFTPGVGFSLNGEALKLRGGCVHHDCGPLGAAAYDCAEIRKVVLHKANGYNAIRCAHNPPSPAFLDACDRIGMLVIDEAFDCWREGKRPYDYSIYFESFWKRDMASMLLRDRNHPCIIMWSTGNEVWEKDGRSDGYRLSGELADYVRSFDNTRAVTNAINNIEPAGRFGPHGAFQQQTDDRWGELTEKFIEPLDVAGYNYLHERYAGDSIKYPDRLICGLETYPLTAYESWTETERLPNVIGDFVWTSMGYLGEAGVGRIDYKRIPDFPGPYPWHMACSCDIDICGFKRPQSYFRDCLWGISKAPYIAVYNPVHRGQKALYTLWGWPDVISSWSWEGFEGQPVSLDVYCVNQEVELLLNGRTLGRKPSGKSQRYITSFETPYEPGELMAVGYENGKPVSHSFLRTAKKPRGICLTADTMELNAIFGQLAYVTVEVVDSDGNLVPYAGNSLNFSVDGPGTLLAVANSDPTSEERFVGSRRNAYEGKALVIIRGDGAPGQITLTACSEGLESAIVTISIKEP